MQVSQGSTHLDQIAPNSVLFDVLVSRLEFLDLPVDVAVLGKRHDNVQIVPLQECVAVPDDVHVGDGCKDPNLIDGVLTARYVQLTSVNGPLVATENSRQPRKTN